MKSRRQTSRVLLRNGPDYRRSRRLLPSESGSLTQALLIRERGLPDWPHFDREAQRATASGPPRVTGAHYRCNLVVGKKRMNWEAHLGSAEANCLRAARFRLHI